MLFAMIILCLAGGMLLSIQAAINGKLGNQVGPIQATFINFFVGTILSLLLVLLLEPPHIKSLLDVPKWQLSGAVFGILYILFMVFAVQRIGTGIATVAVILGQLGMSILVDSFGWFGNDTIPLSLNLVLAMLFLAVALYFIYSSNTSQDK